jgi:transcription-repair coupling factor (superfamily II helicase)
VESGLDFPRANTLVVDQAQMFGLGQLYQLRGRVGRSDRQAHAVFVVPDVDGVPELARKRLKIILEMDYLGAGFQVAMEDLRLRGAGNILGEVQSGHMVKIGLDMYLEMLEEEVARLKGEPVRDDVQTELNIGITAHIPEGYMDDGRERLKYYKALSSAADGAAQESIELEMRDRFGHFPQELQAFLGILRLKRYLGTLDVQKADIFADKVRLTWAENAGAVSPATLVGWVAERAGRARLVPPAIMEIQLPEGSAFEDRLSALQSELELLRAQ